jgi:4-amino-4-deoxy-L-arabinose transferase-like glycosyltransferase
MSAIKNISVKQKINIWQSFNFFSVSIILLTITAILFRTINLSNLPWGFHVDELDAGYIGRYIFVHGVDIFGHPWPLIFDKFGDFRPAGIFYLSGLSTFLFGVNEFAVRFPGALLGGLTVIGIYLLAEILFQNKFKAICTAFVLAFMPWHIVLSRATSEAIVGLFLLIFGIAYILTGLIKRNHKLTIIGGIMLLVSYLFYHSFRFLVPILVFPLIFYPGLLKESKKYAILISIVTFSLSLFLSFTAFGKGRLNQVIFWNNPVLPNTFVSLINGDGSGNVLMARTFHNKIIIYGREFFAQYVSYFSPKFLFVSGGLPDRYFVPDQGVLLIMFIPLLIAGFIALIQVKIPLWNKLYIIVLLLVSPIPAALTYEDTPNIHRAILMVIPYVLICGLGLGFIYEKLFPKIIIQKIITVVFIILLSIESVYFLHQYAYHQPAHKSLFRNDGEAEMMRYVIEHRKLYDKVFMSMYFEHPIYYLFYSNQFSNISPNKIKYGFEINRLDNIEFAKSECPSNEYIPTGKEKVLIIDGGDCKSKNSQLIKSIQRRDSTYAYRILESPEHPIEDIPFK